MQNSNVQISNADNDDTLSEYNENHSQKQTTDYTIIKYTEKGIDAKNTPTNLTFKDNQKNSIESTWFEEPWKDRLHE